MGVRVSETKPDTRIATANVTLNSRKSRPFTPLMKRIGINTATKERVIERTVKEICFDPCKLASRGIFPFSWYLTIFSNTTMASSTTKPTERVRARRERRSKLKWSKNIIAKVPMSDKGRAALAIKDSDNLPKLK